MLAGLVLRERGGQVLLRHDRAHGRELGRPEHPGDGAAEHRDHHEVGRGQCVEQGGDHEGGVEHEARGAGPAEQPPPVDPVGQHAGRQQGPDQPDR